MTVGASTNSATVIGLSPGTTTSFTVKARDGEGNHSAASDAANVTTTASGGQLIANPGGTYTATSVTYSADYVLPFAFRRVFIDSDNNPATGYATASTPVIGADHVIENGTMLRFTGTAQNDWSWVVVRAVTPILSGPTTTWQIQTSDLGTNPSTTQKVAYQGDGFAPFTYSSVITLMQ